MTQPGGNAVQQLITLAQQYATAASQPTSSDTFPVYTGTTVTNPVAQTGGNIRVGGQGHTSTDQYFPGGTQEYFNKLVAYQQTNPSAYIQYQQALYKSGYYGNSKPTYGVFGTADTSAFNNALQQYGVYLQALAKGGGKPITFEQYLANVVKAGGGGPSGPTRAPLTISYTDPAELKQSLQSAAQQELGRNVDDKTLNFFINQFHGKEATAQRAAYNGAKSATNPEATGESGDYIDTNMSKEENERNQATYVDVMNQLLGVK